MSEEPQLPGRQTHGLERVGALESRGLSKEEMQSSWQPGSEVPGREESPNTSALSSERAEDQDGSSRAVSQN